MIWMIDMGELVNMNILLTFNTKPRVKDWPFHIELSWFLLLSDSGVTVRESEHVLYQYAII